ncbi:hybrid sensor histidine kinase/response regulator [Chlorogloea sp. CCALA 695]|uniref:hybrid sensor histidine kinase/response regulator n=1 Tax=Chlorogloea sp. CCALA 695 TaxID=2107693 RepID=UPI000D0586F5|nr:hybrid sensor histidine kinase/response regulator [Chlorogloea sp. CCALA 695]PSB33787.1 hybrid sensor histidine kinase/response regulator [Chlorogloea sp. CCALA 695]
MVLDTASLKAILLEARSCFLYEDAPDYLVMLEQGMQKLVAFARSPASVKPQEIEQEYTVLMRAAHSIKGGAGIAEIPVLHKLAHKLEDLLEALNDGRAKSQIDTAYELLFIGIEQVKELVAQAVSNPDAVIGSESTLPIAIALEGFLQELAPRQEDTAFESVAINPFILKTVLEIDLEECLQRIEKLLIAPIQIVLLKQGLTGFVEECTLLGQTLNLEWLIASASNVEQVQSAKVEILLATVIKEITQLREKRSQVLNPAPQTSTPEPVGATESQLVAQVAPALNLRIPVTKLDRMSNALGELLIGHERLSLYNSQLYQSNLTLNKESHKLNPINEQVRVFYDQLASPLASMGISNLDGGEFDALQFDQYTGFHTTLQDLQEVMVRVQETKSDIELISRDFQTGLDRLRQQLDSLRGDLTESRLVPFNFLAQRFVSPLQTMCDRYHKSVKLEITNKETLIDQVILEQLQTPLTHLVRNSFDHGIETPEERLSSGKSKVAQITLTSHVQANQVVVTISDDGRGIDTQKVLDRAIETGLYSSTAELTPEQILQFLFMPGFSTAKTVTDLSGRGVGLDVVRTQIERLRGTVQVVTKVGQGTKFTITIPIIFSILPLLLCRCQQRTLAIPSVNILEIIALAEFGGYSAQTETITWHDRPVPIFCLTKILPYTRADSVPAAEQFNQHLGIVLDVGGEPVVVAVNSLLGEKELVLKPFDATVKVPPYIAGCTVLGTGEVVTVLSPNYWGDLINRKQPLLASPGAFKSSSQAKTTILIVDDSVTVRRLLDQVLSKSGYQVVQCRDGKEAVEALNQPGDLYNAVISDIEMPRMDGFSLLREIRSSKNWQNLPVAMLTSRENDQHRKKAKDLGANAYFTKPFVPEKLLGAIASMLNQSP